MRLTRICSFSQNRIFLWDKMYAAVYLHIDKLCLLKISAQAENVLFVQAKITMHLWGASHMTKAMNFISGSVCPQTAMLSALHSCGGV